MLTFNVGGLVILVIDFSSKIYPDMFSIVLKYRFIFGTQGLYAKYNVGHYYCVFRLYVSILIQI